MDRRLFLLGLGALSGLTACGSRSGVGRNVGIALERAFGNPSAFDPAYVSTLPYASLAVSQANAARALLVLAKVEGEDLHWVSADRSVLVTRHGRLVQTVGLIQDLQHSRFVDPDFFGRTGLEGAGEVRRRQLDLMPGHRYAVMVTSEVAEVGREVLETLAGPLKTVVWRERCRAPQLDWSFENLFWVDEVAGQVWRSRQHVAPGGQLLDIQVMKPAQA